jgi:hypothetical protein
MHICLDRLGLVCGDHWCCADMDIHGTTYYMYADMRGDSDPISSGCLLGDTAVRLRSAGLVSLSVPLGV